MTFEETPRQCKVTEMASSESDSSDIGRVILTPRKRLKWLEVEISDTEIKRDWRIRITTSQKFAEVCEYYCAYGTSCPVKLKVKKLPNGVSTTTTNGLDHSNHRAFDFGLTNQPLMTSLIVKYTQLG